MSTFSLKRAASFSIEIKVACNCSLALSSTWHELDEAYTCHGKLKGSRKQGVVGGGRGRDLELVQLFLVSFFFAQRRLLRLL